MFAPPLTNALVRTASALLPAGCALRVVDEQDTGALALAMSDADFFIGLPRIPLDDVFFAMGSRLQLVQLLRRGLELLDMNAARAHGVRVATVDGDVHSCAVAEHTLMLMLVVMRRLPWQTSMVAAGDWAAVKPWKHGTVESATTTPWGRELAGKRLGIVGLGSVGRAVVKLAQPFGLETCYTQRHRLPPEEEKVLGVTFLPLTALLRTVDILSLHLPFAGRDRPFLGEAELAALKQGAVVINTSRGGLIDHEALARALESGHVGGAGLDVLDAEPPPFDHALAQRTDVVITPHAAWLSQEAWPRLLRAGFANIERCLAGEDPVGLR